MSGEHKKDEGGKQDRLSPRRRCCGKRGRQIASLHLAMIRALWICKVHDLRLIASCNQMALASGSSGTVLLRRALQDTPFLPCVSTMAGVTLAGLYLVRFLLSAMAAALPNSPAASVQKGR